MLTRRALLRLALWLPPALVLPTACGGRASVTAQLDHGRSAPLGGTMTFTLTASSAWDAPNLDTDTVQIRAAEVSFTMTEGLVPLNLSSWAATPHQEGLISYRQPVVFKADVPQSFAVSVRLDQEGEQHISGGTMVRPVIEGAGQSDVQTLFLMVSSRSTQIRRTPFNSTS